MNAMGEFGNATGEFDAVPPSCLRGNVDKRDLGKGPQRGQTDLEMEPPIAGDGKGRATPGVKRSRPEVQSRRKERNRMHARKTRERKKAESTALQSRIDELQGENKALRQMIMDRYTAGVLAGLKSESSEETPDGVGGSSSELQPMVQDESCGAPRRSTGRNASSRAASIDEPELPKFLSDAATSSGAAASFEALSAHLNANGSSSGPQDKVKRSRSRQKCTPQERLRLRRERNRLHAKRTRDRKKFVLEASENVVQEMETEVIAMRKYLLSINLLSEDYLTKGAERDLKSKKLLAELKVARHQEDMERRADGTESAVPADEGDDDAESDSGRSDENGDGDDEHSAASDDGGSAWGGATDEHSKALSGLVKGNTKKRPSQQETSSTSSNSSNNKQTSSHEGTTTGVSGNGSSSGSGNGSARGGSSGGSVDEDRSKTDHHRGDAASGVCDGGGGEGDGSGSNNSSNGNSNSSGAHRGGNSSASRMVKVGSVQSSCSSNSNSNSNSGSGSGSGSGGDSPSPDDEQADKGDGVNQSGGAKEGRSNRQRNSSCQPKRIAEAADGDDGQLYPSASTMASILLQFR